MTRIVSGSAKGRTLQIPDKGTRPTSSRVREALFSKLESWKMVRGDRVLDLFAGSGALGIEALSRGAANAVFVEKSRQAWAVVEKNLQATKLDVKSRNLNVSAADFLARLSGADEIFDLVFVDPPYAMSEDELGQILEQLENHLSADAVVVVERDASSVKPQLNGRLMVEDSRKWGTTAAWFLSLPPQEK